MLPQKYSSGPDDSRYLRNLLIGYFFMVLGVMTIAHYFVIIDIVTTLWLGNIAAMAIFTVLLIRCSRFTTRGAAIAAIIALAVQIPPIVFYGDHIFDSIKSLGQNANILALPCYLLITGILSGESISEKDIIVIVKNIFYASAIIAIFTLLTNISNLSMFSSSVSSYQIALKGIFPNKNTLGVFCCIGVMAGFYLFYVEEKIAFILALWAVIIIVLVLSLCRGAILMFFIFLAVFVLRRLGKDHSQKFQVRDKSIRRILLLAAVILVFLFLFNDGFEEFIVSKILREDAGSAGRTDIWSNMIENFDDNIVFYLFGMGFGELNYRSAKDLHNIYINMFTTGGLAKCIVYIYIFGKSMAVISQLRKYDRLLSDLAFSVVISYLVFGAFETLVVFEFGLTGYEFALFFIFLPTLRLPQTEASLSTAVAERGNYAET